MNRNSFFKSLATLTAVALVSPLKLFEKKEDKKIDSDPIEIKGSYGTAVFDTERLSDRIKYLQEHPHDKDAYDKARIALEDAMPKGYHYDMDYLAGKNITFKNGVPYFHSTNPS